MVGWKQEEAVGLNFNPVIVIGCPRSGTSVIARLLQENLGVMMDEGPVEKDWRNPKGYYEDQQLVGINNRMLKQWQFKTNNEDRINPGWAIEFAQWITMREARFDQWGFKDPRMIGFIHWTFDFLENPIFIWPVRTDEQILKSQVTKLGHKKAFAQKGIAAYNQLICKHLNDKNVHRLDLTTQRKEPEIIVELETILNG